jgi:hypothetical protein
MAAADGESGNAIATRTGATVTVTSGGGGDTTPPVLSAGSPSGVQASGMTSTPVSVTTDENASCRYSTTSGVAYASMTNNFTTGQGSTTHSFTASGLVDGGSYSYFVRCEDTSSNPNTSDYSISFSVAASGGGDTTPPVLSGGSPSGALASGVTSTLVSVTTNENASCRYSTTSGVAYASMTNNFTTGQGVTTHSFTASGLTNGGNYGYFIRCQDTASNPNTSDYSISFSVASPAVVTTPSTSSDSSHHSSKKKTVSARTITDSKKSIARGSVLTQRGKKFSKNAMVALYFEKPTGGFYAPQRVKTSSSGSFMINYVMSKPKGKYGWYVLDLNTGKKSKTLYYTVR